MMTQGLIAVQAEDKTKSVKAKEITLTVPESWKEVEVANNFRAAELQVPAAEGDAEGGEIAVFPPMGGSVDANIQRWVGQFNSGASNKMSTGTCDMGTYYFVDLTGTFKKPVGPPIMRKTEDKADYRMLAVIIETKSGNYFLRMTGPKKTVAQAIDAFRASFGGSTEKEKEYEIKTETE
jgi:gluconolactonase